MAPSFDSVRDPTGVPLARYDSTIWRNTSRARSPRSGGPEGSIAFM